ncbi:hypothetical protein BDN72DRAFT_780644 [Pluteus cervinus]|uniref:Uncharacterized protein n=1 Tax=Pluteus cervinus TaxID=181527 RepID=A0ACD3A1H7_9AGAR|nr:hypothetical protein BDN72DRAFT_780644 [Pluteus cervinus]
MAEDVSGGVFEPFWKDFPLSDIHLATTPDVLHQLYQGVFKHIISWCQRIMKPAELDRRIRALPLGHGLRRFKNGISALSQISGKERKNMAKILLGCLVGAISKEGISAVHALLDFVYLAQYPTHDTITLGYLEDALASFHKHKSYFINTGVREHLHIPKFHALQHYVESIKLLGTTDNYNTEAFERFHIDFTKRGWRASNQRNEFPQMIRWLSRKEKVAAFHAYLESKEATRNTPLGPQRNAPKYLAKYPDQPNKSLAAIQTTHHAPSFSDRLKEFLNQLLPNPTTNRTAVNFTLPFQGLDVYFNFRFSPESLQEDQEEQDIVKAIPSFSKPGGESYRFDTVVVLNRDTAEATGLEGE